MNKKHGMIIIAAVALFALGTSYVAWNRMDPDFTCALYGDSDELNNMYLKEYLEHQSK